jgi:hypothetical protein
MAPGYIYLLRPLSSINNNENVYKIGKTHRHNLKRFCEYPAGSILLLHSSCMDCDAIEKSLLKIFDANFIIARKYGREYFEGDLLTMKKIINDEITNEVEPDEVVEDIENMSNTIIYNEVINNNLITQNFTCEKCSFYATKLSDWTRHISTKKHKNSDIFYQKKGEEYICTLCDALCSTKFVLKMHQMTAEHRKNVKIQSKNTPAAAKHKCSICEKEYKTSNSLWYHNKKCVPKIIEPLITNGATIVPQNCDLIAELLKQNNELQKQIVVTNTDTNNIIIKILKLNS